MTRNKEEQRVKILTEEQNPKTLTYRCFEAILVKHGILNQQDEKQMRHFRKNVVPDIGTMLVAVQTIFERGSIDDLVEFYLRYGVEVQTYQ